MDLHKQMQKLADAVHGACDEMIKTKLMELARRRLLASGRVVAHQRHEDEVTGVLGERELHVVARRHLLHILSHICICICTVSEAQPSR